MNRKQPDIKETNKEKGTESIKEQDQPKYWAEMGKSLRKIKRKVHSWAGLTTH